MPINQRQLRCLVLHLVTGVRLLGEISERLRSGHEDGRLPWVLYALQLSAGSLYRGHDINGRLGCDRQPIAYGVHNAPPSSKTGSRVVARSWAYSHAPQTVE